MFAVYFHFSSKLKKKKEKYKQIFIYCCVAILFYEQKGVQIQGRKWISSLFGCKPKMDFNSEYLCILWHGKFSGQKLHNTLKPIKEFNCLDSALSGNPAKLCFDCCGPINYLYLFWPHTRTVFINNKLLSASVIQIPHILKACTLHTQDILE